MRSRHFAIPAMDPQPAEDEMNRVCSMHRVVACERRFVDVGLHSYWAVCVTLADGPGPLPDALKARDGRGGARADGSSRRAAVDFKAVLDSADFALFAKLRTWRKAMAEAEGVPLYTVFTNEQLAAVATTRATTLTALGEIEGVGPARLDRYGPQLLGHLATLSAEPGSPP
jgi:superfamily II DNA helicase RecQ